MTFLPRSVFPTAIVVLTWLSQPNVWAAAGEAACTNWQSRHPEWIWCDDFEVDRLASYFEYDQRHGRFVREAGSGVGHSIGMRAEYLPGDPQIHSTYLVCMKAMALNKDQRENDALAERIRFEIRQCVFSENRKQAVLFYELLRTMRKPDLLSKLIMLLNRVHLPLSPLRRWYHKIRYS